MVNFPTCIPDFDSHSPALLDLFFSSGGFPSIGKFWSCCCLSFHWLSIKFTTGCLTSLHSLWLLVLIGSIFVIIWEMFHERISLNLVLLLLLVNLVTGFRLELMYISLMVSIRSNLTSSPWFSAVCAGAIVHRNHFFRLYQQKQSSKSKAKFRQASNDCKRAVEAAYTNKTKESITSQKCGSWGILWINLLHLLYLKAWRCCCLHLIKQKF